MNTIRRFIIPVLILFMLMSTKGAVQAQTDVQYFSDTGHYLRGTFLEYYNAATNPQLVYGSPLTEQFVARDGKTVQYFHKARFELSPENKVVLTPVGQLMYDPQNPLQINSTNGCEQYGGYTVCFTFLEFYKANGADKQFGNPISSFEYENGVIVQSFEGARFEWRANLKTDNWIVLTDLGRLYFDQQKEDPAQLRPASPPDATIRPILSLNARAFVLKAVTLKSGTQSIYVIVKDQTSQVVSNATVNAVAHLSDGRDQEFTFFTNSTGIAQTSFNFSDQKPGELITIDITVSYQNISNTTTTSFRIWF